MDMVAIKENELYQEIELFVGEEKNRRSGG